MVRANRPRLGEVGRWYSFCDPLRCYTLLVSRASPVSKGTGGLYPIQGRLVSITIVSKGVVVSVCVRSRGAIRR
jgi:hypothetical protein